MGDMEGLVYRTRRHAVAPIQSAPVQQATQETSGYDVSVQEILLPPNSNREMDVFSSCASIQGISGYAASVQEVLPPPNSNTEVDVLSACAPANQEEPIQNEDGLVIWLDSPSPDKGKQEASTDQQV